MPVLLTGELSFIYFLNVTHEFLTNIQYKIPNKLSDLRLDYF